MNFTFLCLVITQCVLLFDVYASYNKDVVCIADKDNSPICKTVETPNRQHQILNNKVPSYEPYIPRKNAVFYNCTTIGCDIFSLISVTQLSGPNFNLKHCYLKSPAKYDCETVQYNYYKNIDKVLFLRNYIPTKMFYLADCLVYADGERVCHKKDRVDSHAKLVDAGTIVRPNEANILSQDEFICEQTDDNRINCDHNIYISYPDGLKQKQSVKITDKILLKTDTLVVLLKYNCIGAWCGYSGQVLPTRRGMMLREHYEPPGGSVYRCFYAKKQQICKKLFGKHRPLYNERNWLSE